MHNCSLRVILRRLHWREAIISSLVLPLSIASTSCNSTEREQKQAQLNVLNETLSASRSTLEELKAGKLPPAYDLHLFLSHKSINKVLAAVENYKFTLPNDPSIMVTLKSLSISNSGALPTVTMEASAVRGELSADMYAVAVLVPAKTADPDAVSFRLKLVAFVPKLKWYVLELTKIKFVEVLLSAEISRITNRLPVIDMPVSKLVSWGAPASSNSVTIRTSDPAPGTDGSTLEMKVNYPSTETTRTLAITNYIFLSSGIHIFGVLK